MPRRLTWLLAVIGICAAVALVARSQHQRGQDSLANSAVGDVDQGDGQPVDSSVDPAAAVATILDLREQFGSVLSNSEFLDADDPDRVDAPKSFHDFLWAEAGVDAPPAVVELNEQEVDATRNTSVALAQSMRETAKLLIQWAQQAEAHEFAAQNDAAQNHAAQNQRTDEHRAQRQRFSGLATMLQAEADGLPAADPSQH